MPTPTVTNPIFDCGTLDPMRTRVFVTTNESGMEETRCERRPRGRGIMMVDTCGHTIFFRTTNSIAEVSERDPYGQQKLAEKTVANAKWQTEPMIPWLQCPQQGPYEFRLPPHLRTGSKCTRAADGQPIGEDRTGESHPCKCMLQVRAERQAVNAERERKRDPMTTINQAILNNSQATTSKLTELLGNLVASGTIPATPPPPTPAPSPSGGGRTK